MLTKWGTRLITIWMLGAAWASRADGQAAEPISYAEPRHLADLSNAKIVESSGLAVSRRRNDVFWTHNDSGDSPRLFAFDRTGKDLGAFPAPEAKAVDWEDMASCSINGTPHLLVADVGDNERRRTDCTLYLFVEPDLQANEKVARLVRTIRFRYESGAHDCECVAITPDGSDVYLATKSLHDDSRIYRLPLPRTSPNQPLVAKQVATRRIPLATGMDISRDDRHAVITSYLQAYQFVRRDGEDWATAFGRSGRVLELPPRKQGESICYGADGRSLFLTSEQRPTPFWELRPK